MLHNEGPIGGGRGEAKVGAGGPHGDRMSGTELRGLAVAGPQPCPTVPGATERRPTGAPTTSSSSGIKADEPRTPFGLGERREGDVEPEPEASPVLGRAIGAIGLVIGPGSAAGVRALGPANIVGDARMF